MPDIDTTHVRKAGLHLRQARQALWLQMEAVGDVHSEAHIDLGRAVACVQMALDAAHAAAARLPMLDAERAADRKEGAA